MKSLDRNFSVSILCIAVGALFSAHAYAAGNSVHAGAGVHFAILPGRTINTTSDGTGGYGIYSENGGWVTNVNLPRVPLGISISTAGADAAAVLAKGQGSRIDLAGGTYGISVKTTGSRAVPGQAAYGFSAEDGGKITVSEFDASTSGGNAIAALARGAGSSLELRNGSLENRGMLGTMASADPLAREATATARDGGTITLSGVTVQNKVTGGGGNAGVLSQGQGTSIAIKDGSVVSAETGVDAQADATVTVADSTINGLHQGVVARDGASIAMTNSRIHMSGSNGGRGEAVLSVLGGLVALDQVQIDTANDAGHGIFVFEDASASARNTRIHTTGAGADGVRVGLRAGAPGQTNVGEVTLENTEISTAGSAASGVHVIGAQTQAEIIGGSITTAGEAASGLHAAEGGQIKGDHVLIKTAGPGANAVYTSSANSSSVSSVSLKSSELQAAQGASIAVEGGQADIQLINSQATVNNGRWLDVRAGSGGTAGSAKVLIDPSEVRGAAFTEPGSSSTVTLADSHWTVTGDSNITSLTSRNSAIEFDAAGPFKTLAVQTLALDNAAFTLNTRLNEGGAATQTDKIVVAGDAAGTGTLYVRNQGGAGAFTGTGPTDGIEVVRIGGASQADFKLGAPAIVGNYDYALKKADGQNWFLQSQGDDPVPAADGGGNPVAPAGGGGGAHMADIIPGYNIALAAAQQQALATLDTFHERVGELRSGQVGDGLHLWTRAVAQKGSYAPDVSGYAGKGFDQDMSGFQIGGDYSVKHALTDGDSLAFGLFGEYSDSSFDVDDRTAKGKTTASGFGGYMTWQQHAPTIEKPGSGAYVDVVAKYDNLDFHTKAESLSGFLLQNSYGGHAITGSIETGYGFDLGDNLVLQPQTQMIWSKASAGDFTDPYGIEVHDQEAESLIGRVGVRLEKTFYFDEKPEYDRSLVTFADANALHDFKGDSELTASGDSIGADMGGTFYDIGAGLVAHVNGHLSLYARASDKFGGPVGQEGEVIGGFQYTW